MAVYHNSVAVLKDGSKVNCTLSSLAKRKSNERLEKNLVRDAWMKRWGKQTFQHNRQAWNNKDTGKSADFARELYDKIDYFIVMTK